ncbi:MAG TPA: hypothetical protein VI757_11680 [Bacteroidia bacterium]|nr:hypothetical protein [Bacteroidia bacterium]
MTTIQRQLPFSKEGRVITLNKGVTKLATIPPLTVILNPATKTRLLAINILYGNGDIALSVAIAASTAGTAVKNAVQKLARMWVSHYYQALNNGIEREEIPASHRAFYGLDVNSNAVPDMNSEDKLLFWGNKVAVGEAARIAAGGPPITFPDAAVVTLKVTDYNARLTAQTILTDATDAAQEALDLLNPEADAVIKKYLDEVDVYYSEENPESRRGNTVEWGAKYLTLGEPTAITFKAVDSVSGAPIQDTEFKFVATGKIHKADDVDSITAETRLVGDTPVSASHPDYTPAQQTITVVEGVAMDVTFTLVHV